MNFQRDVTLLTIAYGRPAILEHCLRAYIDNGRPDKHIIWINGRRNTPVADVAARFCGEADKVINTESNLGVHTSLEVATEIADTPYLFLMPDDFRVTRPTWMDEFAATMPADLVGIPGACSISDGHGKLCWPPPKGVWACPPHLRTGGMLLRIEAFKALGKFFHGREYNWQEISVTRRMLAIGMTVKVIEDAPFYDYGHWGRNHWPDIENGTLEELTAFDAKFGVKAQATTY